MDIRLLELKKEIDKNIERIRSEQNIEMVEIIKNVL